MENINSKYVIWTRGSNKIELFDETNNPSVSPLYEDKWENVTITFNDNGSITMEGDEWQFGINFHDEYPKDLDYEVDPQYIVKTRFTKKDIVRSGWHKKLHNIHKKVIINGYVIEQTHRG